MKKITISIVVLLAVALVFTLSAFACNDSKQITTAQAVSEQPDTSQPVSQLIEELR
ncbi:MAG: hypothetical protein Q4A17_01590 [Thermoguttaceae bacterium]|nr:hypothetical protein [Thermoguttaceae bacterium]